ncbi:MAG: T9SS type A sorting domain-containing protein, partial [Ignavibacteriae bacterium]|nr:T9SS type A sorting domain-containing protein [Ignavibacteriota bacterium]
TKIRYSVPTTITNSISIIQLKIFDVLGREVKTLVNEVAKPGNYEVIFDASELSSGIYFYTLKAGDFNLTNKMNFIK